MLANVTYDADHTFAGPAMEKILGKNLPAGMYAFVATVYLEGGIYTQDGEFTAICELRDGAVVLGGATAHSSVLASASYARETLTLNGTRDVSSAGTEISIWCQNFGSPRGTMRGAQMMTLQVAGSF